VKFKDRLKLMNILLVVDNKDCTRLEQTNNFLKSVVGNVILCDNYASAYEIFQQNARYFNLIILSTELSKESGFYFISNVKKLQRDTPFLFISTNAESEYFLNQGCTAKNYLLKPVNFKELLEKIHTLCFVNHKEIDEIIKTYDKVYQSNKNRLALSDDDLKEIEFIIDDYEVLISEMICVSSKESCYNVSMNEVHQLLHKTYNVFYTFIDEDIKDAIEPFALAILSFINCVDNLEIKSNNRDTIFETMILLLEDILGFIEDTVRHKVYMHSQYLVDSFIANIDYLKVQSGMMNQEEDKHSQLDFF
jgi:DNA-binding response OmpR family regulator